MSTATATIADQQFAGLQVDYPASEMRSLPNGTLLVSVPDVPLPPGWNQAGTTVKFIVPVGYPASQPDCFWTDPTLRLASGAMPANSGVQKIPDLPFEQLWFSWHVAGWHAGRNTLATYMRVIRDRLSRAQ